MHGVGLDQCEIRARNDFDLTVNKSLPLAYGPAEQDGHFFSRPMVSCNFIAFKRAIKFCSVTP